MQKVCALLLVVVISLCASACASSTAVVGETTSERSTSIEVAATPTPDPMATVPPAATAVPTPALPPTPQPTVVLEPTSVPTPVTTPAPLTDAQVFASTARSAARTIDAADVLSLTVTRTFAQSNSFDFSLRADVILDDVARSNSIDVGFSGADWRSDGPGGWDTAPWRLTSQQADADESVDRFGKKVTTDPAELRDDLQGLLGLDGAVERQGSTTFLIAVAVDDVLALSPGESVSPWTSSLALVAAAGGSSMPGSVPVQFTFSSGRVEAIAIDYGPVISALADAGVAFPFSEADFREVYLVSYSTDPAETTGTIEVRPVAVGDCFVDNQFLAIDPTPVSCSDAHTSEVIYADQFEGDESVEYPGNDVLIDRASPQCETSFRDVTGVSSSDSLVTINVVVESPEGWQRGSRRVMCVVLFDDPITEPLTSFDVQRIGSRVADAAIVPGDCFDGTDVWSQTSPLVPCTEPHRFQAFATFDMTGDDFPGDAVVNSQAEDFCQTQLTGMLLTDDEDRSWFIDIRTPSADGWLSFDDRRIICFVSTDDVLDQSVISEG